MDRDEIIPSFVLAAHALARIAAQEAGNEAPSAQWRVLSVLSRERKLRLGELARQARTTQPGMTRLVGELERHDLVRRSSDPSDSRATVVAITEKGLAALVTWREELKNTLAPRFVDLDDAEWAILTRAADIIMSHAIEHDTQREETNE